MAPFMRLLGRCLTLAVTLLGTATAAATSDGCEMSKTWDMGGAGFALTWSSTYSQIRLLRNDTPIWSTVPNRAFLSASAGNDSIVESSGNFNVTPVDRGRCQGQNMTGMQYVPWPNSLNDHAVSLKGYLRQCTTDEASVDVPYTANFWVSRDLPDRVSFALTVDAPGVAKYPLRRLYLTYSSTADEDFYGLGAQASFASLKNQSVPIFTREQGVGRGDEPTTELEDAFSYFAGGDHLTVYTAIPQYISNKNNALYLTSKYTALAYFDFTELDSVTVRYDQLSMNGQLLQGNSMLDAVSMVSAYTGRMTPLPTWVDDGAIIGIQGGESKVKQVIGQGTEASCPMVGVWLQDWTGVYLQPAPTGINVSRVYWNWESDKTLYPGWDGFVQQLQDEHGVRTLTYINPFLANLSTKASGMFTMDLFAEATRGHYMIQNLSTGGPSVFESGPSLYAGMLDLTNDETLAWFAEIMRSQVWSANISGYMCDFGEYSPVYADTGLKNASTDALVYHNRYPRDWARFQQSVIKTVPQRADAIVFFRSASLGSAGHMNLFWAGDQDVAWAHNDGIQSVPAILGHMGLSGYAHTHGDIGGYTTTFVIPNETYPHGAVPRSSELLGRWGELAAVSNAVFRSHEGEIPQINAQPYSNASTFSWFSHNARLFRALGPYRRNILDRECAEKGWPLVRFPVVYHPDDRRAANISASFYLGPDLYVAPVLEPGVDQLAVYLPGNEQNAYTHLWSGATFKGGRAVSVKAPYGQPPIFLVDHASRADLQDLLNFVEQEKGTVIEI